MLPHLRTNGNESLGLNISLPLERGLELSYSVSASGPKDKVVRTLHENFSKNYPDPGPGVSESFEKVAHFADEFLGSLTDTGWFGISVSGHANGQFGNPDDQVRDSITVYINPANEPTEPKGL